jgi:arylamine N-acetyltransferase
MFTTKVKFGTDPALSGFLRHFDLSLTVPQEILLRQVIQAFARLPYENLTKIIQEAEAASVAQTRPTPEIIVAEHIQLGTGGTCFSLTATLVHLLRQLGWQAEPILADRPYGPNTHCALLVWIEGRPHLVDPGYLLTEPIPLETKQATRVPTSFHALLLLPKPGDKLELQTIHQGKVTPRITFKTNPVDESEFREVWDDSFSWEMMRYPVVTAVTAGQHLYLQGNRLQTRSRYQIERRELPPEELARHIAACFGIDVNVAEKALLILKKKGEKVEYLP